MKENFKNAFGAILGFYAGLLAVNAINGLITNKPDKKDAEK